MNPSEDLKIPVLLYDGSCGLCRGGIGWFQYRIPPGKLAYLSTTEPEVCKRFPHLTIQNLNRQMYFVSPEGQTFSGARAIAQTLKLSPKHRWLGFLLDFWPIRPFAAIGYRILATLRHHLSKKACKIKTEKFSGY